ncbi:Ni/Fe-hydrogenase, b-type cytochrome subunit [Mangrovimicrobium sediminis]|uniref:Ni/Fe-hydrogenase, b-type cytochrome subunit n=1 Tax=Mangrovimicrobium sediminis TaxID=2562682 RepID=A0A4Z0M4U7_9GAMM|nr:Ni/Fe-hydrogenase, b-type cytochrome subunit [Haliea sp. SAOS-164]TGD74325.1 Ni/Fe-hydrogenase, b-type cytochrome subunit [Haliea sp. SAOS-164]
MELTQKQTAVYVYEAPVRLWHWVNALCIVVLSVTGYLIANPLPTLPGEASDWFVMGYIRFAHFAAAYIFTVGFIGRVYWSFVGNRYSREIFHLNLFNREYWKELVHEMRWYAFLAKEPKKYVGHNPLAAIFMVGIVVIGSLAMMLTGFALYAEQSGPGSWQDTLFGWLIPLVGQSQDVRMWHHWGMWIITIFAIIHIYAAVREDIMSRQSLVSTMISGWRMFKDDRD